MVVGPGLLLTHLVSAKCTAGKQRAAKLINSELYLRVGATFQQLKPLIVVKVSIKNNRD